MAVDFEKLGPEERAFAERMTRSSWSGASDDGTATDSYKKRDLDALADHYTEDVVSAPANHHASFSRDEIRAWYAKRTGDFDMNAESEVDTIDIVGDIAVATGTFRVTRAPEAGVVGLDHGGRFLTVYRRGDDGKWRIWRDMDQPSPDADHFYGRLERGW